MRQRFAKEDNIFKRTMLSSKLFTIVMIVIIVLIAQPLIKKINQRRELNKEISEMQEEVKRVENKNEDLKGLIDYLESDSFVEKEARLNLDLRRPGEKVAVVKDINNTTVDKKIKSVFNIPGLNKQQEYLPQNNWQKWYDYFFLTR